MKRQATRMSYYVMCILIIAIVSTVSVSKVNAQPWMEGLNKSQKENFFEIQKAFNNYWKDKDYKEKGKGWKLFKRWEWFWQGRVNRDGSFPNPMQNYNEIQKLKTYRNKKKGNLRQTVSDWVSMGPSTNGGGYGGLGRVNCVRQHPTNSAILWAGAASGGLWKSTNTGQSWTTNTDELASIGITDLVYHPTNSNIMYLATGDGDHGDAQSVGVLKSTDGGTSWNTTGLNWSISQVKTISRLLIHPTNGNILIASTNDGIYRTINGGTTWARTLDSYYARDMEFKPSDANTIYAAGDSFYRSVDNGVTWTLITEGLPAATDVQRIALAVTPNNSNYVYALLSANNSGFLSLCRSTNSGTTWTQMSTTPNILGWEQNGSDTGGQGWYDLSLAASPTNAELIFTGGVNCWKSTNGGTNWTPVTSWTSSVHADHHDLWFVPNTDTLYNGNDGGVYRTVNSGANWTWLSNSMVITQYYRLGCAKTNENYVICGAQDNGTKLLKNGVWTDVIGGDGMECAIDPVNPNYMYGELYYGNLRKSVNGGVTFGGMGLPTEFDDNLGAWVTPFLIHPLHPEVLYAGYRNVWKSTNRGSTWRNISNFTTGSLQVLNVAESDTNVIYASTGSNFMRTTNAGTNWISLSLPTDGSLASLAIHPSNPLRIWACFSGYNAGQKVYYSTNGGTNWTNISGGLPNVSATSIVMQYNYYDRLYVGTDIGVFYKDNLMTDWQEYSAGLPNVPIGELEINYRSSKLRAATFGRGLWEAGIQDSPIIITPLGTTVFCPGASFQVSYTVLGGFNNNNVFTVQLSDVNGNFISPVSIGYLASTTSGTINVLIPSTTTVGTKYRIRIVTSNPQTIGNDNGVDISVSGIITNELSVLEYYPGDTAIISFNTPCIFNADNTFTVQLSNADGSFDSPTTIGTLLSATTADITCIIPTTQTPGANYRVRVIGSSPQRTGTDNGVDIHICGLLTSESFDSLTLPNCWKNITNDTVSWDFLTSGLHPACLPHSGQGMAYFNSYDLTGGKTARLVTIPLKTLPSTPYSFSLWFYRDTEYYDYNDRVEVYYNSTPDTIGATLLGTICRNTARPPVVTAGGWYKYAYTINNPPDKCYFIMNAISEYGNNMYLDDISVVIVPVITLLPLTQTAYCTGNTVNIPFSVSSAFAGDNIFTAQLSDASGNFDSPILIGTLASSSSGTITATIPDGIPSGTNYKLRIFSSNPETISNLSSNVEINNPVTIPRLTGISVVESNGNYTPIAGTSLGNGDDNTYHIASPFTFFFDNVTYSQGSIFSICSNGWLSLDNISTSDRDLTPLSLPNTIAWAASDLYYSSDTCGVSYLLEGSEPNRVLTFQWKSACYWDSYLENMNAQIKLYETSNKVEIIYGDMTGLGNGNRTNYAGFSGNPQAGYYINIEPNTTFSYYYSNNNPNTDRLLNSTNAQYLTLGKTLSVAPVKSIQKPQLIAPANDSIHAPINPELSWSAINCAITYCLQVSTDSTFVGAKTVDACNITQSTYTFANNELDELTKYFWRSRTVIGNIYSDWSDTWTFTTRQEIANQTINLNSGWNLISAYLNPFESDVSVLLTNIISNNNLLLLKNKNDGFLFPYFDIDNITAWNTMDAYWTYVFQPASIEMTGQPVIPENTPIPLHHGWNWVPYLRSTPMNALTALSSISGKVLLVKNAEGQYYNPANGLNTLEIGTTYSGKMIPGKGYMILVNQPCTLIYPAN